MNNMNGGNVCSVSALFVFTAFIQLFVLASGYTQPFRYRLMYELTIILLRPVFAIDNALYN